MQRTIPEPTMMTQTSPALMTASNTVTLPSTERVLTPALLAQAARLGLAVGALHLYDMGSLPLMVTVAALLDGVLVGGTAAVAAALVRMGRGMRLVAAGWSVVGLCSLIHVAARLAVVARDYPGDLAVLTQGSAGAWLALAGAVAAAIHVVHLSTVRGR